MILITGATGFIGKNLVPELAEDRAVRLFVRKTSNITHFKNIRAADIVYGDLEHNRGIENALRSVDTVIHCAGRTIGRNYIEYHKTNVDGTINLVRAMKKRKVPRIIFLSSQASCGPADTARPICEGCVPQPVSSYGKTKLLAERTIRNSNLDYIILRPSAVYGPYDMDTLKYIQLLNRGICPVVGSGEKFINLIYVDDLIRLIITILKKNEFNNRTYFVHDGICYSYNEVTRCIARMLKKTPYTIHVPAATALVCGLINDVFLSQHKGLVWRDKVRELAGTYWLCDNEAVKRDFGFIPHFDLNNGLYNTIEWYQANHYLT